MSLLPKEQLHSHEELSKEVKCSYIDKEVDMGYFENYFKDGQMLQSGCNCISHCTCDCNRCALPFG